MFFFFFAFFSEVNKKPFLKLLICFKKIICTFPYYHTCALIYFFNDNVTVTCQTWYGLPFLSGSVIVCATFQQVFWKFPFPTHLKKAARLGWSLGGCRFVNLCGFRSKGCHLVEFSCRLICEMSFARIRLQKSWLI